MFEQQTTDNVSSAQKKKKYKMRPNKKIHGRTEKGIQYFLSYSPILLIAPHGVMGDDDRTNIIAFEAQKQLDCFAIINKRIKKDEINLNSAAAKYSPFTTKLTRTIGAKSFKLAVWIHGGNEKDEIKRNWERAIAASEFDCEPDAIGAFIGYGQGPNPKCPKDEPDDSLTAKKETVEAFRDHLTKAGMVSVLTGRDAPSYRGREPDNMNQWLISQHFPLDRFESIQIEIRYEGFRDSKKNAEKTGAMLAKALKAMFPDIAMAAEKAKVPTNAKVSIVVHAPKDVKAAEKAYKKLSGLFKKHITASMLEAGQYVIETFYGGNARLALAKNKSKDNPPSLNLLIEKLKQGPEGESGDAPSVSWFYKAVNLAAHEAICKQMRLSTFTIIGHSHKLQLLNVPKLKKVKGNEFDKAIEPAFKEKERLAKHAHDNNLTVRRFKEYIDEEHPRPSSIKIDWNDSPSRDDLVKLDHKVLIRHWNEATKKVQNSQEVIGTYGAALNTLEMVLAEKGKAPVEREGRFRDWTEDNFNICRGCSNDCLYCYAKPGINFRCKVEKGKWHQMEIVDERVQQPQRLKNGLVGFPSTHDIFPGEVLEAYLTVLGKFLRAGNEVLIVTKPRLECIKAICHAADPFFKDRILFRFTIGAMDDDTLGFWEPNAPTYQERKACLQYAFQSGFRTSVSMEPLLAMDQVHEMISELRPFVSRDIWIGTMNHLTEMKKEADEVLRNKISQVEKDQSPEALRALYDSYKNDKLIQWKTDALKAIHGDGKAEFKWDKKDIKLDSGETKNVAAPVIVSATRRSDIPASAELVDKFMKSLRHKFTWYRHRGKWINVSLENTRFIVFWTKNPRPLIQHLDEIDQRGYGYYFLYTINDYEQEGLESGPDLPPLQERIDTFKELAGRIGKERVIWRFDPLILTNTISKECLIDKVGSVMEKLTGYTEKLVFSFFDPEYENGKHKLKKVGITAIPFTDEKKVYVAWELAEMATEHGMQAATCADPLDLSEYDVKPNKCVDYDLIRRISGQDKVLMQFLDKAEGLEYSTGREHCDCSPAYDIGNANTCGNGCVYCYANDSEKAVKSQIKRIKADSEMLSASIPAAAIAVEHT